MCWVRLRLVRERERDLPEKDDLLAHQLTLTVMGQGSKLPLDLHLLGPVTTLIPTPIAVCQRVLDTHASVPTHTMAHMY